MVKSCRSNFDFFGNSHGIFHLFVVAGVIFTHRAFSQLLSAVEEGGSGEAFCARRGVVPQLLLGANGTNASAAIGR